MEDLRERKKASLLSNWWDGCLGCGRGGQIGMPQGFFLSTFKRCTLFKVSEYCARPV